MKTDIDKRKQLIRKLLIEELLPEEREDLVKRESVEKEMQKQWKLFADDPVNSDTKKRIWQNVQRRCEGKPKTIVHMELWQNDSEGSISQDLQ